MAPWWAASSALKCSFATDSAVRAGLGGISGEGSRRGDLGDKRFTELARRGATPFAECKELRDAFRSKVGVAEREGVRFEGAPFRGLRMELAGRGVLGDLTVGGLNEAEVDGRGERWAFDGEEPVDMASSWRDRASSFSAAPAPSLFGGWAIGAETLFDGEGGFGNADAMNGSKEALTRCCYWLPEQAVRPGRAQYVSLRTKSGGVTLLCEQRDNAAMDMKSSHIRILATVVGNFWRYHSNEAKRNKQARHASGRHSQPCLITKARDLSSRTWSGILEEQHQLIQQSRTTPLYHQRNWFTHVYPYSVAGQPMRLFVTEYSIEFKL